MRRREPEHLGAFENRQQVVNFEPQIVGYVIDVFLAAAIVEQFDQAGNAAGPRMRNDLRRGPLGMAGACRRCELQLRLRHNLIYIVHVEHERRGFAVARVLQRHAEIRADARRIAAEHDNAVGQQHGLFDVVRHDENAARGNFLREPQLQQFVAQAFRRQHVQRGERLVHEKNFRLHGESAREPHALLHPARKFFRERILKALQAYGAKRT